ncbi:dihydroorotate dehydrogenase electron transfer subunit [Candidatus Woesearchaeota archaeon]|nr:dihydroorotate dehydrogenase electron transfer subunit [Candidatus Woesearchaeota archaeon]
MEQPQIIRIENIVDEAKELKSFVFNYDLKAKPGQFVIAWIPRVDEKPFGVCFQNKDKFAITVSAVGKFTKKMHKLEVGDFIGIRGPYGKGFDIKGKRIVIVGGGYGTAPLAFLADEAHKQGIIVDFIIGAKTKEYLPYIMRMKKTGIRTHICTDDGSCGFKGFTTDVLKKILKEGSVDMVYACGPEIMMKFVIDICNEYHVDCEISLERYMKCGFGVCGQCAVDPTGWRVCKEGPVFAKEQAKQITEFARYKRDASGKKVKL